VWGREVNGLILTFHLAGINNQNFLMRDEETGTYWQQISGLAISGPLAGKTLLPVHCDELTFALWKSEEPHGTVMKDVAAFVPEYSPRDWDVRMKRVPTVISHAEPGLAARDLMLGAHAGGAARAFPYEAVKREKLILDRVGTEPVLLVLGLDNESVRAFSRTLPGGRGIADFYRITDQAGFMVDSIGASHWNFRGCATEGPMKGACLTPIELIKDYWFDWREYNPETTVFGIPVRR
jgi:Protein of unknown function (DUF3179)